MIDKVAFTGKEGMLINVEKAAQKKAAPVADFVLSSSVLPEITKKVSKAVYTSPFAPVLDNVGKVLNELV